jgi:uncharacterized membrane protein YebE (DUF533 family)
MQDELRVNVNEISAAGLGSLVNCAVAIAAADGETSGEEHQAIAQQLKAMLGDAEVAQTLIEQAFMTVIQKDQASIFEEARAMLEGPGREAAFTLAAATAARAGGIGTKEGIALQALARALEIGYPSAKYNELLGKGMRLAKG